MRTLSCDAGRLYRDGGFPGDPWDREPLVSAGPAAEFLAELHPPFRYPRPIDRAALDGAYAGALELMELVNHEGRTGAACGLFRVPGATLRDGVVYLARGSETCILYETHRPIDRPTLAPVTADVLANGPVTAIGGLALYLGSAGSFNYGHWIVDDLSRQAAFSSLRVLHPRAPITVVVDAFEPKVDAIRRQSLDLILGLEQGFEIRFVPRGETVAFEDLHYASPTTQHPLLKSPEALRGLAALLRRRTRGERLALARRRLGDDLAGGRLPRLRRRLYVERRAGRSRPLVNEAEVAALLAEHGFEGIDPETLTFASQVARFAEAGIVVGPMGAAMTTSVVCAPGTHVVHLAHEGWTDPFFWDLACVMGHRFSAVYGRAEGPGTLYRPYAIDLDALRRRLRAVLGPLTSR